MNPCYNDSYIRESEPSIDGWKCFDFKNLSAESGALGLGVVNIMRAFTAVIERCPTTGLYVGHVPGFPGAHSQGETLEELRGNLAEVIQMLLEEGEPQLESEFIGTERVQVA